ncbi:MAG TPA: 4Fe-4S dicluster domain-containing protein [Tepidisphaeraceae bacterium]|nr:4Fe-4S dicluster domain-containing protein [Tepidisphaeraceae bacterium]
MSDPISRQSATAFCRIPAPSRLMVPLGTRPPGEPTNAKLPDTRVRRGEPLAENMPETAHVPLSPADGVIVAQTRVDVLNGHRVAAVEIQVDRTTIASPEPEQFTSPESAELPAWIDRLRFGGFWAERRNSPDLLAQLYQALRRPCDTIVCNALDAEEAVPLNASLSRTHPDELIAGVRTLARALRVAQRIIAVDADAPAADVNRLRGATHGDTAVRLAPMANSYPQADPTLMLYTLLRRRLRPGRLPPEAGVILLDAAAAVAVGRIALSGQPMLDLPLAIREVARDTTHLVTAPVGTPIWHILNHLGIDGHAVPRVGEALRDQTVSREAVVSGGELVVHVGYASPSFNPDPCIRCGWCAAACPTRIQPAGLLEAAQRDSAELAERYGIHACIECGVCSYVCPSRLPLLGAIRELRRRRRP